MGIAIENAVEVVRADELIVANDLVVGDYQSVLFTNMPPGTKMVFQESVAPSGWSKQTSSTYSGATVIATTGSVSNGGSLHVKDHIHSGSHTHSLNHSHTFSNATHKHSLVYGTTVNIEDEGNGDDFSYVSGDLTDNPGWAAANGTTSTVNVYTISQSVTNFGGTNIKYLESIVCSKL